LFHRGNAAVGERFGPIQLALGVQKKRMKRLEDALAV
jgi:hypothetical protein